MSYDVSLFVGDLLRSCGLIALALALGGIFWAALGVRRADIPEVTKNRILDHSLRLAAIGAALVAITQGLGVMAKAQALAGALNVSPYPDFFETTAFQTGLIRTLFAALLGGAVVWLRRDHSSSLRWGAVFGAAALLITTGAWQAHGASRAQDREILMTLTVLHQLGAAVWVGGVLHLIALWRLIKKAPDLAAHPGLWPGLLARFTPIGIAAVVLIAGTGGVLAFDYVDNLNGLIGTAYGSILSVKWILAACALGFAGLNFAGARRGIRQTSNGAGSATPFFVESEGILLLGALFVATTLAALPPAIDLPDQRATGMEVLGTFAPRLPQIHSPSIAEIKIADANPDPGVTARTEPSPQERWSNFNHNVAGIILFGIALAAALERTGRFPVLRHWPLGFIIMAVFVLIRADNEVWPYGDMSMWQGIQAVSTLQHKIAFLLTALLGVMEWRARNLANPSPGLPYFFPILCMVGGILLLTHSHAAFEIKTEYLVQLSHSAIGVLALFMGVGRWLELRLDSPAGRMAGHAAAAALMLVSLVLMFYQEPLG